MNFYLSSFKIGDQYEKLKELIPNKKVFYINNALDSKSMSQERREWAKNINFEQLKELGIEAEHLDLKDYFGKEKELEERLNQRSKKKELNKSIFAVKTFEFIISVVQNRSCMDQWRKYLYFVAGHEAEWIR